MTNASQSLEYEFGLHKLFPAENTVKVFGWAQFQDHYYAFCTAVSVFCDFFHKTDEPMFRKLLGYPSAPFCHQLIFLLLLIMRAPLPLLLMPREVFDFGLLNLFKQLKNSNGAIEKCANEFG